MNNILGIIVSFGYIIILMLVAKYFEKFDREGSRKFIHILLGNWWLIAMAFFDNVWCAIIPPIAFTVINFASYKLDLIKVMERNEKSADGLGTVYFAVSLIPLVILSFGVTNNPLIGLVGFFAMTYGDGFAALIGKSFKSKEYTVFGDKKTVAGSMAMFLTTLMIALAVFGYCDINMWIIKSVGISVIATLLEAVSIKGIDNLTVPIMTSIITFMVM